jgi:hypothetical protein
LPPTIRRRRSISRRRCRSITFRLPATHRHTRRQRCTLQKPIASCRHRRHPTPRHRRSLRLRRIRRHLRRRTRNRARRSRGIQRHTGIAIRGRGCCGRCRQRRRRWESNSLRSQC